MTSDKSQTGVLDTSASGHAKAAPGTAKRSLVYRIARRVVAVVLSAVVVIAGIWAVAALSLANLDGASARIWPPIVFGLAFLCVIIFVRPHRRALVIAATMVIAIGVMYFTIFASNDRVWVPEHSRLATATIDGDRVTIHNSRVLEPGPDGTLREIYTDQTFDLRKLTRGDLIMSYWGPQRIAHALVSFEFSDNRYVGMSIEVRRRASQKGFNMLSSLFRNFELIYIVGNERALIGGGILSENHRLFLYRTNMPTQRVRALFLRYAEKLNSLAVHPEWYNAVTDNCTTGIYMHLREIPPPPPFNINILLNGYLPERIYQHGSLDRSIPFAELNRLCDIKEIGRQAYNSPDFSRIIRERVPAPPLATSK